MPMNNRKTSPAQTASQSGDAGHLNFDVSSGLKRVLGRELITADEVAIFELVKNSFDAGAHQVHLHFDDTSITVADDGSGMTYDDLVGKWLFVAYSAKRSDEQPKDFRDVAVERKHFAGSKGIGRFSSDRVGAEVVLQTLPKASPKAGIHELTIDWDLFDLDDQEHFEQIPVSHRRVRAFAAPAELQAFVSNLHHGTVIQIRQLRRNWSRLDLIALKASLAKLINPFGAESDSFSIHLHAPAEFEADRSLRSKPGGEALERQIVNGRIGNFIFSDLQAKTTFIQVSIEDSFIYTALFDRGELIYRIREPNRYLYLGQSGFKCEIYYLNHAAKTTFTRRVGLRSVQFGSVFLFRNGFRVYPVGETSDDYFGFDRRKQQGYSRYLGTREIIGRVDVTGSSGDFEEASSRDRGLIETPAALQLRQAVLDHCLKRLERYVVPVLWVDKADANTEDLSRLSTDAGRARVAAAVASLVDNSDVELLEYNTRLVGLLNERSDEFEASLGSLKEIADRTGDKSLLKRLKRAERRYSALRASEAEARHIADRERAAAEAATARAESAEAVAAAEQRRAHFLEAVISLDTATILNLHHQVTIYAVDVAQQIENLLSQTAGQRTVPRDVILRALEQMSFLNRKIIAVTRFATRANFKLDSERIETDLPGFITDYITNVARAGGGARLRIDVINTHSGMTMKFNPIDVAIVIDNLISNAKRARASRIRFTVEPFNKSGVAITISDNGHGLASGAAADRIFEMGFTTTRGSGLGLYHVRQVLSEMNGTIEIAEPRDSGLTLVIKIAPLRKSR